MLDEFREAIRTIKPHYLCVGNCYILIVKEDCKKILDLPTYYVNFQGASDKGLYCYSLLEECQGVFFFSAWANIASVATTKYYHQWRKILDEMLMLGCLVVMVEAPLAQKHYKHPDTGKGISIEELNTKRANYKREVIDAMAHPDLVYQDMVDTMGYDTRYLVDQYPTHTPWHLSRTAIKKSTRYFVKVMVTDKGVETPFII